MKRTHEDLCGFDFDFYDKHLNNLKDPTAKYLFENELCSTSNNAFGFKLDKDPNRLSFFYWLLCEKSNHSQEILLVQVGDFFELIGVDAILGVEYCGLRAMGKRPSMKAGAPLGSVQRILDGFVRNGMIVRVYEEVESEDHIFSYKHRRLIQVVSASNPLYYNSITLLEDTQRFVSNPLMYILDNDIILLYLTNHTYHTLREIESNNIHAIINCYQPFEIYSTSVNKRFVTSNNHKCSNINSFETIQSILNHISEKYMIKNLKELHYNCSRTLLPRSTTRQIGMDSSNDHIPSLVLYCLGACTTVEKRFFSDWIRIRPSAEGRESMSSMCELVSNGTIMLQNNGPLLNPSQVVGILHNGGKCKDLFLISKIYDRIHTRTINNYLHLVTCEYLGIRKKFDVTNKELSDLDSLLCKNLATEDINNICLTYNMIPDEFLRSNEQYIIKTDYGARINECRHKILNHIHYILSNLPNAEFRYSSLDNDIVIFSKTNIDNVCNIIKATNKKGTRKNHWTTLGLIDSVDKYKKVCEEHDSYQKHSISELSLEIIEHYSEVLQLSLQGEVIVKCVYNHLSTVIKNGWNSCLVSKEYTDIKISGCFPYWMSSKSSTSNNINIVKGETILLTAPNAYGKTTIIRSVILVTILGCAGFYVPAKEACLPCLNQHFLRLPCSDSPAHNMSSFQTELHNLQWVLNNMTSNSIICFDEFARSTSPEEGIALCIALLEFIKKRNCFCIFSTHFLRLICKYECVRMLTINESYNIIDGYARNSRASNTCSQMGICSEIIDRMDEINNTFNEEESSTDFEKIISIAKEVTDVESHIIGENQNVPPLLTMTPCVYIIMEDGNKWYCGETKNIIKRRHQHLQNKRHGKILIYPMANKTIALNCETLIQRKCIERGIILSSYKDSQHVL